MSKPIYLYWWNQQLNFGDRMGPFLARKIMGPGRKILHSPAPGTFPIYYTTGSILPVLHARAVVWGSGLMLPQWVTKIPAKTCAVRGPLTRRVLLDSNQECPEVYGDPGLLLPRFLKPTITKTHRLGIVPHYVDQQRDWVTKCRINPKVKVIDVGKPVKEVVEAILACECIVSSSLHGLIVADAYGMPSRWVELSREVYGGGFKFHDYYAGIGAGLQIPLSIPTGRSISVKDVCSKTERHSLYLDLDLLLDACPFREKK